MTDSELLRNAIAAAAFTVAVLALVLGEVRARRGRRTLAERNVVGFEWRWVKADRIELTNAGPDEMRDVLVILTSRYVKVEAQARRLRKGERLPIDVPHLSPLWHQAMQLEHERAERERSSGKPGRSIRVDISNMGTFGASVYWRTPLGNPKEALIEHQLIALDDATDDATP